MPKPPTEKDAALMRNLTCTLERASVDEDSALALARIGMSPNEVYVSETELGKDRNYSATDLRKRWMWLKQEARKQCFEVLHAEHLFLESIGFSPDEIAGHIRNSGILGRQFGRLSGTPRNRAGLRDEEALAAMIANPTAWFRYDAEREAVDFSPQAKEQMRESYDIRLGCPALANTVACEGKALNMYDIYWEFFAENFAQAYVLDGGVYTRLTVSYPND